MDRWIESVSKFDYPFDLLIVDNSPDSSYIPQIHAYCHKYGLTNYHLVHIDVNPKAVLDERLAQSRETIRQEVLDKNYDAWFSLECDIIAPPNALSKLIDLIDDYWMIGHTYPTRGNPNQTNEQLGLALIKLQVLKRYSFINEYGYVNPHRPDSWYGGDVWFLRRIDLNHQGKRINISGIIKPIYHLSS